MSNPTQPDYARKMRSLSREEYQANPASCLACGKLFEYESRTKKFCNLSCFGSYNVKDNHPNPKKLKLCACGKSITDRHNKWCDACIERKVYNKKAFEDLKSDKIRRQWLIKNRGHRCEICNLTEWLGQPITLELDHIDGNADNNVQENLRIICPNCHSYTPFWKGKVKNKEGGRYHARRKRYANGETW